jgi:hypothetical protein
MREALGEDQIRVMFGVGNDTVQSLRLADVHQQVIEDGLDLDLMLPGVIPGNAEASRANVREFLSQWNASRADKTFFLMVSDHGQNNFEIEDPHFLNNCIDTWAFDWQMKEMRSWGDRCLSREDLQAWLPEPERANRIVFAMSQCFSGGFHSLSVKIDRKLNSVSADSRICGFTSTAEDITASGCTPLADGPDYAGYERSFTKQMIGNDFITGEPTGAGFRRSLKETHRAAVLEDWTTDVPYSTSDFYLAQWARLIAKEETVNILGKTFTTQNLRAFVEAGSDHLKQEIPGQINPIRYPWIVQEFESRRDLIKGVVDLLQPRWNEIREFAEKRSLADLETEIQKRKVLISELEKQAESLDFEAEALKKTYFFDQWLAALSTENIVGLNAEERELLEQLRNTNAEKKPSKKSKKKGFFGI